MVMVCMPKDSGTKQEQVERLADMMRQAFPQGGWEIHADSDGTEDEGDESNEAHAYG